MKASAHRFLVLILDGSVKKQTLGKFYQELREVSIEKRQQPFSIRNVAAKHGVAKLKNSE